ncbi:MAG: hypothetical protein LUC90_05130 [Lachnospiraceae bacterium]|nr:hypothetical protein [Lachnospiraceae bacterium]
MVEYLKIVYVRGQQVLDGRGNPTLEAAVTVRNCVNGELTEGKAIVPNGTDRERCGEAEPDGADSLCMEKVKSAARNIEQYLQEPLAGTEVTDQRRIDHILRETAGRENKPGWEPTPFWRCPLPVRTRRQKRCIPRCTGIWAVCRGR